MSVLESKWHEAQPAPVPRKTNKVAKAYKARESLVPGAVLILLAGRFRGKRVVLLKILEDNTLLVTGPFKLNGVPLRRVNASYVIGTSTKVNVSSVDVSKFNAAYFARDRSTESKISEEELFGDAKPAERKINDSRIADQKAVDAGLLSEIKKTPLLSQYLATPFSLKKGDRPHQLKF
ncbi:ribosomal 60S subunit protein L6B [Starmerella bacillaris]|uniref:Ribosomal 60S subunit protein L6B n=1 Tax=Starmerella bacillaris TaxID=1247836 RepID=A0AAV5RJM1_STABA|nr:ribosomal 60S subunit protein L6B [Starmerella bacillaris]